MELHLPHKAASIREKMVAVLDSELLETVGDVQDLDAATWQGLKSRVPALLGAALEKLRLPSPQVTLCLYECLTYENTLCLKSGFV